MIVNVLRTFRGTCWMGNILGRCINIKWWFGEFCVWGLVVAFCY